MSTNYMPTNSEYRITNSIAPELIGAVCTIEIINFDWELVGVKIKNDNNSGETGHYWVNASDLEEIGPA